MYARYVILIQVNTKYRFQPVSRFNEMRVINNSGKICFYVRVIYVKVARIINSLRLTILLSIIKGMCYATE